MLRSSTMRHFRLFGSHVGTISLSCSSAFAYLRGITLAAATMLFVAACSDMEPFEAPITSDIPEGPGLFTGEDGEAVIFRR